MTGDLVNREIDALAALVWARKQERDLLLLLDYDGTLVEIAPRPESAVPSPELLNLLARLSARPDMAVAVVSGRPLSDLLTLLPIPGLNYLGSHGGEGLIQGRPWRPRGLAYNPDELEKLKSQATEALKGVGGWWLEDKPLGFALHYRQASASQEAALMAVLTPWLDQVARQGRFQVLPGKKVVELLPDGVSKGAAIQEITVSPGFIESFPVYLGDDFTDEGVFQMLAGKGLTVKVGRSDSGTAAAYWLARPAAVRQFLARLARHREDRR
ncbi:MAG: trehalose-phosphatase [Thermodesulfobacteriota bacterium]